jgi:Holliday junction DNA helicase RuvA
VTARLRIRARDRQAEGNGGFLRPDSVILDVHGVGYLVHCSTRTLEALPGAGEAAQLSIETHVREQEIKLFGFSSDLEREWFRLLLVVQG